MLITNWCKAGPLAIEPNHYLHYVVAVFMDIVPKQHLLD